MKIFPFLITSLLIISCDEDPYNHAPEFVLLQANPETIKAGEVVELTCLAIDADGDQLTYWWSSDTGEFIGSSIGTDVTWKSPDYTGDFSVTAHVSDGNSTVTEMINLLITIYPSEEGRDFADLHYNAGFYWILEYQIATDPSWGDSGAFTGNIDDWMMLPWNEKLHFLPREGFEHNLPTINERGNSDSLDVLYYEYIGYYVSQFGFGWDDGYGDDPGTFCFDGRSPNCEFYVETWLRPR